MNESSERTVVPSEYLDRLFANAPHRLRPSEVAELLGVQTPTVYGWLERGLLPAYKIGSTWIIFRDELREALRSTRKRPGEGEAGDRDG